MNRATAGQFTKNLLNQQGLNGWSVRITTDEKFSFLGMCDHAKKCIIINAHHVDINPDGAVYNTLRHEVAHAIVGAGHGHDEVWAAKARELGCDYIGACGYSSIPEHIVDAIRSGANVEMEVETIVHTQVEHKPKFTVTRLQEKCPTCGKPAKEKISKTFIDKDGSECKMITLECFHVMIKKTPKGTAFDTMVSNFWKPEVGSCNHKWNKHQCELCNEFRLMPFQLHGARFIESGLAFQKGVLVADEMGLGKTVQALAMLRFHKNYLPFLVITKSAITYQWFSQIIRWLGQDHFSQILRTGKDVILPGFKSYIAPYDLLRRMPADKLKWLSENIKLVILDECQQIKNPDSSRTQEVRKICKRPDLKVIELSGTPWKNRGSEFFTALNLIDPIKFYSYQNFLDTWVEYYWEGNKRKMGGIRNIPRFKSYTNQIIIRREFDEVIEDFPQVNRVKLPVKLDEFTQATYDESVSDFVDWYNDYVISGEEDKISGIEILAQMARMRHVTALAKIPATLGFVEEFIEDTDRKLVIFVHHIDVAKLMQSALTNIDKESNEDWCELAETLKTEKIPVLMYHSGLDGVQRSNIQNQFNNTKRVIMIASTLACGEGVDLQTCSDCILHERQWNPQNEDQAAPGRFKRIGQAAKVINITVPHGEDTIDDDLDEIVARKRAYFHAVHNKGEIPAFNENDFARELAQKIVTKHNQKNKGKKKNSLGSLKVRKEPKFIEIGAF